MSSKYWTFSQVEKRSNNNLDSLARLIHRVFTSPNGVAAIHTVFFFFILSTPMSFPSTRHFWAITSSVYTSARSSHAHLWETNISNGRIRAGGSRFFIVFYLCMLCTLLHEDSSSPLRRTCPKYANCLFFFFFSSRPTTRGYYRRNKLFIIQHWSMILSAIKSNQPIS